MNCTQCDSRMDVRRVGVARVASCPTCWTSRTIDAKDEQVGPNLSYDLIRNTPEANRILGQLISGTIKIRELFTVPQGLFYRIQVETQAILKHPSPGLQEGHPTYDYVKTQDPSWAPAENSIHQYSLYNTKNDFLYFDEDHQWGEWKTFHQSLRAIPELIGNSFDRTVIQNCRLQSISGQSGLGLHRERIIAIPGREHEYKLRFHLPIQTNGNVEFVMDGEHFTMQEGKVYLFNQSCLHGVMNNDSEQTRIHLVWDVYLNDRMIEMIRSAT